MQSEKSYALEHAGQDRAGQEYDQLHVSISA